MRQHRMQRWSIAAAGFAVAALALAGCGGGTTSTAPAKTPTVRFGDQLNITTLDPASWSDVTSMQPMQEIYDTLVEYAKDNSTIVPGLAYKWKVSPDGKTYTFYLRKGLKFSNGDPVTAQDVIYDLNRVTSASPVGAGPAPYGFAYSDIQGYTTWNASKQQATLGGTGMTGLSSPAPNVVQIALDTPQAYFLNELALMSAAIIDPAEAVKYGANYQLHAIGTGPYKVGNWNKGHQLVLVASSVNTFRPKPQIQKIVIDEAVTTTLQLLRFQQGEYDFMWGPLDSATYAKTISTPSLKKLYHSVPENGIVYLAFNTTKPPFNNVDMRLAVNYALNKQLIVKDITNGRAQIASQPLPPLIPGYNSSIQPFPYDPNQAKALLKSAGYNGAPITFIYLADNSDHIRMADMIQQQLEAVGMKVTLKPFNSGSYWSYEDAPSNPFNIAWTDWFQDYPDGQDFLENLLGKEAFNATNVGEWTDPTFQKLIDTADALPASQDATRYADFQQAETIAHNKAAWGYLYYYWNDALVQPWIHPSDLNLYLHPVKTPAFEYMTTSH